MREPQHTKFLDEVPKDAKDYPFIWLWHTKVLPAGHPYIYGVIEEARRDKAPPNAIHKSGSPGAKAWSTTDDVRNEAAFLQLGCGFFPAPRKARYLREDAEKARLEMERLFAEAEQLSPENVFRVTTAISLDTPDETAPGMPDARELVRVALQTIQNDGYEDERIILDSFKVL